MKLMRRIQSKIPFPIGPDFRAYFFATGRPAGYYDGLFEVIVPCTDIPTFLSRENPKKFLEQPVFQFISFCLQTETKAETNRTQKAPPQKKIKTETLNSVSFKFVSVHRNQC